MLQFVLLQATVGQAAVGNQGFQYHRNVANIRNFLFRDNLESNGSFPEYSGDGRLLSIMYAP